MGKCLSTASTLPAEIIAELEQVRSFLASVQGGIQQAEDVSEALNTAFDHVLALNVESVRRLYSSSQAREVRELTAHVLQAKADHDYAIPLKRQ